MGIFDGVLAWYRQKQENRLHNAIARNAKVVRNPKANRDDRKEALNFFLKLEDVSAVAPVLLDRFDYSLEHGINDTREKETAMQGLLKFGDELLPWVEEKLRVSGKIAWPIKVLAEITTEEKRAGILESCLAFDDVALEQAKVEKNYDVLCYLADYPTVNLEKVAPFLKNPDERIRFIAATILVERGQPEFLKPLEVFIEDDSSENRRIHKLVVDAFVEKSWKVENLAPGPIGAQLVVTKERNLKSVSP